MRRNEQVSETAADVEKAAAATVFDRPAEVALDALQVGTRRRLFQSREFVRILIALLRAGAEEIVVAVDRRKLLVGRLRVSHDEVAAVAADDRQTGVSELVDEMLGSTERAAAQGGTSGLTRGRHGEPVIHNGNEKRRPASEQIPDAFMPWSGFRLMQPRRRALDFLGETSLIGRELLRDGLIANGKDLRGKNTRIGRAGLAD